MADARLLADRATAPLTAARPAGAVPGPPPAAAAGGRWRSTDLLGPASEIEIEHGQSVYRLRLTSLGKLILTK